jgi:hypothetical protein
MRHDPPGVGQASDQASDSVGQAGAGDPDDIQRKGAPKQPAANESFGSVAITGTDTGSDQRVTAADRP